MGLQEAAIVKNSDIAKTGLAVRYLATGTLVPAARNARTHSAAQIDQIAASMREFGWTNPILVDEDGGVIAGHGRLEAARTLGMESVPTIALGGLSAAQKRALVLADNKLALNAGWDDDLLRLELAELKANAFDISTIGFSTDELSDIFADRTAGLTDPDDAPAVEAEVVSKPGDLWLLGGHRLLCGDCTKAEDVARAMGDAKPHLMVTDPPYGVNYDPDWRNRAVMIKGERVGQHGSRAVGRVTNDKRADWQDAWALFAGAVAYVWHGGLGATVVAESLAACRLQLRAQIVWVKTRPLISRGHYHWQHEPALYAVRDGGDDNWRFIPEHEVAAYAVKKGETAQWQGSRKQSTVWFIEHLKSETGHSTQKPVECMKRPIENNSRAGDAVYDPFVGSVTTIIAAEMTGRNAIALEVAPQYVDVCVRRWQRFTGRGAMLEATGEPFPDGG